MKVTPYFAVLLLVLAVAAGSLGAYATNRWLDGRDAPAGVHAFVHEELDLTQAQEVSLEAIERDFAAEHNDLELALRSANAGLAQAMTEEHRYGPKVATAIDRVHLRMGDLQKATVRHVFRMRALLTPEQQKEFDREVNKALTSQPKT
ncbi:periplasmic heavy metal sensor [Novosphingobium album (ex Hu et al. 2023)]|uniref:Periplasmic heavy metal sensor n=1 Tax=Novosphingobium album (ex Hu et al. 2023) TaxID=2930093 RepID=A0ABT0B046_9SPHN|nr:periplasmic heavy metal sensor [Novosphingobium album (ex Hu et al. 2023)]MCJ2178407.1 periplasmic heavy metal sensor [Novosphingobium album (ex Hu et al. 2023)]